MIRFQYSVNKIKIFQDIVVPRKLWARRELNGHGFSVQSKLIEFIKIDFQKVKKKE